MTRRQGATLAGSEDIPPQSCRQDRVHRSVRGSYYLFQAALWLGHSSSRSQATGEHQRNEQSDRRVDRGTGDGCLSLGRSTASPDSRPRRRIRSSLRPPHSCHGDSRSPDAPRSPWQNGHVERLIGSIRRESLDHLIVFDEEHLRSVLKGYASYYNEVRTHLSLDKDAPHFRRRQKTGRIAAIPILGGLHHQ